VHYPVPKRLLTFFSRLIIGLRLALSPEPILGFRYTVLTSQPDTRTSPLNPTSRQDPERFICGDRMNHSVQDPVPRSIARLPIVTRALFRCTQSTYPLNLCGPSTIKLASGRFSSTIPASTSFEDLHRKEHCPNFV
jgi:hypothetical protein